MGDDWPRFVECYRERYFALDIASEPFPGVVDTLDALRSDGFQLAIVTSKLAWRATEELARAGLFGRFAAVVGWEDSERHKPEPDPLRVAMGRLGVGESGSIAYVGDTPADVRAARAAGCHAIGAAWGSLDADRVREENPDVLVEHPADVLAYVRRVGPER